MESSHAPMEICGAPLYDFCAIYRFSLVFLSLYVFSIFGLEMPDVGLTPGELESLRTT